MKLKDVVKHGALINRLYKKRAPKGRAKKFYTVLQGYKDALELYNTALNNYINEKGSRNDAGQMAISPPVRPKDTTDKEAMEEFQKQKEAVTGFFDLQQELEAEEVEVKSEVMYSSWSDMFEHLDDEVSPAEIDGMVELGLFDRELPDEPEEEEERPKKGRKK